MILTHRISSFKPPAEEHSCISQGSPEKQVQQKKWRLIVRNWLTWSRGLRRSTDCCLPAGGGGEPAVQFQSKPGAQEWGHMERLVWVWGAGVSVRMSLKVWQLGALVSQGRRRWVSQLKPREQTRWSSDFLLCSGLDRLGEALTYWGGWSSSLNLLIQTLSSSGNILVDTPEIMSYQVSGHPLTQSSWQRKWIITALSTKIIIKSSFQFCGDFCFAAWLSDTPKARIISVWMETRVFQRALWSGPCLCWCLCIGRPGNRAYDLCLTGIIHEPSDFVCTGATVGVLSVGLRTAQLNPFLVSGKQF